MKVLSQEAEVWRGYKFLGKLIVVWDKREKKMLLYKKLRVVAILLLVLGILANSHTVEGKPRRILLDTDVDTDDFFALLYLLKLNRSEFELEVSFFSFIFIFGSCIFMFYKVVKIVN